MMTFVTNAHTYIYVECVPKLKNKNRVRFFVKLCGPQSPYPYIVELDVNVRFVLGNKSWKQIEPHELYNAESLTASTCGIKVERRGEK